MNYRCTVQADTRRQQASKHTKKERKNQTNRWQTNTT